MRAAYNGHTDRVRAFRLWGRGDVDGRWVTALLLYRYWCPSPPMSSGNKKTGDPPGSRGLRGPGAAPLPAQLRAFHGHSGVALHWHDHSRPTEPASGAWWVRGWGMWVLPPSVGVGFRGRMCVADSFRCVHDWNPQKPGSQLHYRHSKLT